MSRRTGLLFACALLAACAVSAQDITEEPPRPMVTAVRLEQTETVTLDGRLDEPVWKRAVPATDFTQRIPQNESCEQCTRRTPRTLRIY